MTESRNILIIDDEAGMRDMVSQLFTDAGYETATAPDGAAGLACVLRQAQEGEFDLVVLDMSLPKMSGLEVLAGIKEKKPDLPVIIITAYGSAQTAIEALRLGAYDYITKPFDLDELQMTAERAFEAKRIIDENRFLRGELKKKFGFDNIIGTNSDVQRAYVMAAKVGPTNATVLVTGETGTGKEYLARTIHYQSGRAGGPFIKVNCAALSESLLESELFGHEKGAFTHAVARHIGRFEVANKGTIFLDEIGDISLSVQTKLLRVLQEKQFERVGGSETLSVDVRVIAATNRDLIAGIKNKDFREDLYYRLNVITLRLPPIRERGEDIEIFGRHFLKIFADETGKKVKKFSDEALAALKSHNWPGNIRELENAVERSVILCNGETIRPEHLMLAPIRLSSPIAAQSAAPTVADIPVTTSLRDVEKIHIERVLKAKKWNQSSAATALSIDRKTLRNKIREFRLEKDGEGQ
ncbi:MAG: sigma-54 dependent transcriptional regulator [Armatimonadetes bacterium]|nr:sigma-54 dependent transcriptional regulator [Armatimonadota bacterium]